MNAEGRGVPVVSGPLAGYEAAFRAHFVPVRLCAGIDPAPTAGDGLCELLA